VTERYKTMIDGLAKQQAELAGARLANLLNAELK